MTVSVRASVWLRSLNWLQKQNAERSLERSLLSACGLQALVTVRSC